MNSAYFDGDLTTPCAVRTMEVITPSTEPVTDNVAELDQQVELLNSPRNRSHKAGRSTPNAKRAGAISVCSISQPTTPSTLNEHIFR